MADPHPQPGVTATSQYSSRRVPDHEWEEWREHLERLYVDEDVSLMNIVQIMAEEHGFIGTDLSESRAT